MMKSLRYLAGMVIFLHGAPIFAIEGGEVMQNVLQAFYYQGHDLGAQADMLIEDNQGRQRIRQFSLLRLNLGEGGKQKYYVYFNKPADVSKMVFMAWKNVEQDDDRWLYLPALDLVRRIAASDERASFVGSHFFYEDISGRSLEEDVHQLSEETAEHYIIKSTPKSPKTVEFSSYQVWVDKKTFLPMKIEYYNSKAAVIRHYRTLEIKNIDGYSTIIKAQMEDKQSGGKTTVTYSSVKYSQGVPENIFSERYLRKAPKKYLE